MSISLKGFIENQNILWTLLSQLSYANIFRSWEKILVSRCQCIEIKLFI